MKSLTTVVLLGWLCLSFAQGQLAASPATVAVLDVPGLPVYGGIPSLTPGKIPALLQRYGLKAEALSLDQIVTEKRLNPTDFPVLILPYGDAFPLSAASELRSYHAAGGCLVVAGIPFSRSAEKVAGVWQESTDRVNYYGHDDRGLGTGGFARSPMGTLRIAHHDLRANPLKLEDTPLPETRRKALCLMPKTLDPDDEVIPLVELVEDGANRKVDVASVLIRHHGPLFQGALDVWIGQVAQNVEEPDAYFASQIVVRGTAWCLREKGRLTPGETEAIFTSVGQMAKPVPYPSGLAYHPHPRPWGDTFLPKSNPPARRLQVVDIGKCAPDERRALYCLQALTSRKQPCLWLTDHAEDTFWLDYHVKKGYIDGYDLVPDWHTLFRQYADAYKGAIVPDANLYRSDTLAADVAGCEDLIVASPELAAQLNIPVKIDLRGRFASYAEGLDWVWKTYRAQLNPYLCDMSPILNAASAYPMEWRGVIFWPAGSVDDEKPGADMMREKRLVAQIMSEMEPNSAMLGFPFAGTGVGLGEVDGVKLASGYGISLVCSDFLGNTCVTSGVPLTDLKQAPQKPAPKLGRDKIYIALAVSDGDNQNSWERFYLKYFQHPRHGEFPVAFGVGPPILDLQPARAQWYYERAGPNTEFLADVSGVGYIQPENYAVKYRDPAVVWGGFLDWTARYQHRLDLKTLRTVEGEDDLLGHYADKIDGLDSLFADMGRYGKHQGIANLTYSLPSGTPVFRAATTWNYGKTGFLREVHEQVGDARPAFVNGFIHCWTYDMDAIAAIYDHREPDMVFVTPAQLAALYKKAQSKN